MINPPDLTILYVDDEIPNLQLFELMFNDDYRVVTAISGEEGLEKLQDEHSSIIVVVSDMRMPGMNGVEFVKKAKEKYNGKIAYFILTGFGRNPEIETALKEHVIQRFFTKPFDRDEVRGAITDWRVKIGA